MPTKEGARCPAISASPLWFHPPPGPDFPLKRRFGDDCGSGVGVRCPWCPAWGHPHRPLQPPVPPSSPPMSPPLASGARGRDFSLVVANRSPQPLFFIGFQEITSAPFTSKKSRARGSAAGLPPPQGPVKGPPPPHEEPRLITFLLKNRKDKKKHKKKNKPKPTHRHTHTHTQSLVYVAF